MMTDNQEEFFLKMADEQDKGESYYKNLQKRLEGLLPKEMKNACILITGVGSVGSYLAEQLVRSGVGRLILIDPDIVESHNLTRTVYKAADIGKSKVEALRDHLKGINPWMVIEIVKAKLENVDKEVLKEHVRRTHLIICGADTKTTQALINRIAGFHDKPLIVPGLYKRADGGEVVYSVPKITPCYKCTVAGRSFAADNKERKTDYATGRLQGEIALAPDIHHVTGAAVKISLSLLSMMIAGDKVAASQFLKGSLQNGTNYLLMSMTNDYWFFPEVFGDTPGQYAYQSVWLQSQSNKNCDICGEHKTKNDPIDEMAPDISTEQFEKLG